MQQATSQKKLFRLLTVVFNEHFTQLKKKLNG